MTLNRHLSQSCLGGGRATATVRGLFLLALLAILAPQLAIGQDNTSPEPEHNADVVEHIGQCAAQGRETVLFETEFTCADYGAGAKLLQNRSRTMPLQTDALAACKNPADKRALSGHAIKSVVLAGINKIEPMGIRINGAIFCQTLDLIGLNLPYSLVIDHSIFAQGIEARNFKTAGDFSIDGGVVFGEFRVARSRIGGTIFASGALIQKAEVLDSEVRGSLLLRTGVLLEPAIFDTVAVSGELSLRGSQLPYFLLQFSSVGGVLDLTQSQARCSYQLRKDEIGDLVAVNAGFGNSSSPAQSNNQDTQFEWAQNPSLLNILAAATMNGGLSQPDNSTKTVNNVLADRKCDYGLIASPSAFVVSDTTVKKRLCVQSFHWLSTSNKNQKSDVTLNGIQVGASAFIDLIQNAGGAPAPGIRQLEMLGFQTRSLIFNFGTPSLRPSYTLSYLNGIQFDQVYSSKLESPPNSVAKCGYDPQFASPSASDSNLDSVDNLTSPLSSPTVDEVMLWLNTNLARTTQPFAAFVDVFQKNGEDSAARQLRITKANAELRRSRERLFAAHSAATASPANPSVSIVGGLWDEIKSLLTFVPDAVGVFLGYVLRLLADSGYRPEKVGWFVALILLLSFVYFWFVMRVIAIRPERTPHIPLPIGFTFLFDRLLPAYQIREDHYKIQEFLQRVRKGSHGCQEFKYLRRTFYVVKLDENDVQRVERALDVLKFLGLILAVFLVAAINSLVNH